MAVRSGAQESLSHAEGGPFRVRGAFLSGLDQHRAEYWRRAVRNMHRLGMDVAVLQTEAYLDPASGALDAVDPRRIAVLLDEAAANAIRVFIGLALAEECNGNPQTAQDAAVIGAVIERSLESATRIHDRYGRAPAFAGFYLPLETWTPGSPGELGFLPDYLLKVGRHCRGLARSKEIAISPFISDLATDPRLTETLYAELLGASEIDVVLLQDGVGARALSVADLATRVKPYLLAMKAATVAAGRQMWVNAESFAGDGPAPRERLQAQLELARTVTPDLVTFDYASFRACISASPRARTPRRRRP